MTKLVNVIDDAVRAARAFGGYANEIGVLEAGQAGLSFDEGRNVTVNARGAIHDRNLGAGFGGVGKPQVPELELGKGGRSKADREANTAARDAFADEVDSAKQAAKTTEDTENDLLKTHEITWSQWLSATTQALEQEKAAIEKAATTALASTALSSQQKIQIMQREKDALAEIARQEADAQAKAAEVVNRDWTQSVHSLEGIFASQLNGILSGTESWGKAMTQVVEEFAEQAIRALLELATFEAVLDIAGGGVAGAAPTGIAGAIGHGFHLPGFDVGSWSVPRDMVATVHQGEMIVPSRGGVADEFRSSLSGQGGGSGGDLHVHVNAMDSQDVMRALSDNLHPLSKMIANHWTYNRTARPAY